MKNIKILRLSMGITQRQLSQRIGCHQTTIAKIEAGDRIPSCDLVDKLAVELECKKTDIVDDIYYRSKKMQALYQKLDTKQQDMIISMCNFFVSENRKKI